jgi:hypothetical protein
VMMKRLMDASSMPLVSKWTTCRHTIFEGEYCQPIFSECEYKITYWSIFLKFFWFGRQMCWRRKGINAWASASSTGYFLQPRFICHSY